MKRIRRVTLIHIMMAACGFCFLLGIQVGRLAEMQPDNLETEWVPVAIADLQPGLFIDRPQNYFKLVSFPNNGIPPSAIKKLEDLWAKVLSRTVYAGEPCRTTDLAFQFCDLRVVNHTAVTVRVKFPDPLLARQLSGNRVDVIATVSDRNSKEEVTGNIAQNVLVLNAQASPNDPDRIVVTLGVKPEDALRVLYAGDRGSLSLAVRKQGDEAIVDIKPLRSLFDER
jgi:Flp pilus assembly protein CpaB